MNLLNKKITHKTFGEGYIVEQDESFITIDFKDFNKKFVYPDAFGQFITLEDRETAKSLKKIITKLKIEQEALEKEQEEKREQEIEEQRRKDHLRKLIKNNKIHESSQIVFWLDEEEKESAFSDWQVSTGTIQSGKNKGQPNKPARLLPNSAALLTVRESDQDEKDRRILGIYMVTETYTGNLSEDGMVPSHEEFKIQLTDEESEKMLFWNYYINHNYPHRMTWNSGKYRYYDNVWTAQILKDIIALRSDEEEIKMLERFLDYFCKMNSLDINNIPEAAGALKQE